MRVLIACEYSGVSRRAFEAVGCEVWSADFEPADDNASNHYQGDCFDLIGKMDFDLMIAHPPCTYLSVSGMHWTTRGYRDPKLTDDALDFVQRLMDAPIAKIAIENPVSVISTRIRKPDQIIQPYQFGDDASKATCLWLKNLPKLIPTKLVPPKEYQYKGKTVKRWGNQGLSGRENTPPSPTRWKKRSITYAGIAQAWALQWTLL